MTKRMAASDCPVCETRLDAATGIIEETTCPQEGDITICMYCASVLEFTSDLALKEFTGMSSMNTDTKELVEEAVSQIKQLRDPKKIH